MKSPSSIHILLIINGTDFGGTESALAELARGLDHRGHSVEVLSLKAPGWIGEHLKEGGIQVHTLEMEEVVRPWNIVVATLRLSSWLRHRQFDIVQSFLPRANIISRLANRLAAGYRPHISSERSTDFNRSILVCRLNQWTSRWTDCVLAVSGVVRQVLVSRDRLPREKVHILGNGLDVSVVDATVPIDVRAELELRSEDLVFCAVGRLIPDKGYPYLIQALASMPLELRPQLVIVGEGDDEERIRREVSNQGLEGNVHFTGFRGDVPGILKGVDAFVLSSLEEGIPVVLLEAMACGLPIVSTNVGGIPNLVVDEETALLVAPAEQWRTESLYRDSKPVQGDGVVELARAMERLAADPNLRAKLGTAGRHRLEEIFSLDRTLERLEEHYQRLLDDRPTDFQGPPT